MLYRGGRVLTVDPAQSYAEAVATREGRIVAVGSEDDCRRALGLDPASGDGTTSTATATTTAASESPDHITGPMVCDLAGRTLLPGFNDAHIHPLAMSYYSYGLKLDAATSVSDILDALADRARVSAPGEWVMGLQISAERLAEQRLPSIAELDAVAGGHAVVLIGRDGHTSLGNTVALAAAGIRPNRVDPPGGRFERDDRGRLTGVCRETATRVLMSSVPVPDLDQLEAGIHQVFDELAAHGVTSAGLILQTDPEGPSGAVAALESVGMMIYVKDVRIGTHAILCGHPSRAVDARTSSALHDPAQNRIVGGVKLFLDGTFGARTARMHEPYADATSQQGMLTIDTNVAASRMEAAHLAGLQICVHAIGDAANTLALDLFDALLAHHPPASAGAPRHRIEHASVLDDRSAERFAELGIAAVVQPLFLRSEAQWLDTRLGPERARRTYPFRRLVDAGVVLAGSSDAPFEDPDVLAGIYAAVTRHGFEPAQALTATEAVEMYTQGAAIAQGRDDVTGRIAPGLQADLVVLSDDPTAVPADALGDIDVCLTVVRGQVIYASELVSRA